MNALAHWTLQAEARRGWPVALAWAPHGRALALAAAAGVALYAFTRGALSLRALLAGHAGPVRGLALSADGALLASAGADRSIRLWNLQQGGALRVLAGHEDAVLRLAFSPDGTQLVSAAADGTLRLHEVATGRVLRHLRSHTDEVSALCFCDAGRLLASGSRDRQLCLHDARSGTLLRKMQHPDWLRTLLPWPADDACLLSASRDGLVRLWPCHGGAPRLTLHADHGAGLDCAAFTPDGALLFTGGRDGALRAWRVADAAPLGHLAAHAKPVLALAFSPDGRHLASAGGDNRLRLWARPAH